MKNKYLPFTEGQMTQQVHLVNFHKAMIDMELKRIEERRRELAHAEARLREMQEANMAVHA